MLKCRTCGHATMLVEHWDQEQCGRSVELATICPQCLVTRRSDAHVSGTAGKGTFVQPEGNLFDARWEDSQIEEGERERIWFVSENQLKSLTVGERR